MSYLNTVLAESTITPTTRLERLVRYHSHDEDGASSEGRLSWHCPVHKASFTRERLVASSHGVEKNQDSQEWAHELAEHLATPTLTQGPIAASRGHHDL
jgi:hypothetical protein